MASSALSGGPAGAETYETNNSNKKECKRRTQPSRVHGRDGRRRGLRRDDGRDGRDRRQHL
jgi:hypothetical protein